jgi:hypothetical protein
LLWYFFCLPFLFKKEVSSTFTPERTTKISFYGANILSSYNCLILGRVIKDIPAYVFIVLAQDYRAACRDKAGPN